MRPHRTERARWPPRVLLAPVGACLVAGCAHYGELAAGEALTVGDGRRAPALAVEVVEGVGASNQEASNFTQARGRALVGVERQQLAGLVGASHLHWAFAETPLWGHVGIGPGVEHLSLGGEPLFFFEAIAQARLGTGFVLGEVNRPLFEMNPWGIEAWQPRVRGPQMMPTQRVVRERALLTLALAGDVDARFTRAPLFVASLLLGVAFVEEPRSLPRVELDGARP